MAETIHFITWNVNGLREQRYQKLKKLHNADVIFLQETHIGEVDDHFVKRIEDEWHIYCTKYSSSQRGTAILFRKTLDFTYISAEKDRCGGYVVLKCKLHGQLYTLVSVYNHQTDTETLDKLSRYLQSMTEGLLVIGGDFNTVLNPFIDKKCKDNKVTNNRIHSKLFLCVENFMKALQLADIWRRKHPAEKNYTFCRGNTSSRLDYFFIPEECMWRVRSCEINDSERPDHQFLFLEINNVPTTNLRNDPWIQSVSHLLSHKNHFGMEVTDFSLFQESALSEVDIISAVQSLQVSDTPRPDGIPASFYKENIQDVIPYIKVLYNSIVSGTFNCTERRFNEFEESLHDNSQHFFNVDYLIIAMILARRLEDFLDSQSERRIPRESHAVLITPKTLGTETMLRCFKEELNRRRQSNQDFLAVANLVRNESLPRQGCPLTPVLITLALKCYASTLFKKLVQPFFYIFKQSVVVCIRSEELDEVDTIVTNTADEEYEIVILSRENGEPSHLNNPDSEFEDTEDICLNEDERSTMYAVVTLQDTDEVMVTASKWLNADKTRCHWPPFRSAENFMEAVKNRLEPLTSGKPWDMLNIILHAEYDTYEDAVEKQEIVKAQNDRPFIPFGSTSKSTQTIEFEKNSFLREFPKFVKVGEGVQRSLAAWINFEFTSHGMKRKLDVSPTKDANPRKKAKRIVEDINTQVQAIKGTDHTITTLQTHITDAISKMDKGARRKATVGIFGRTGEGKSSLLNAVLGRKSLLPSGGFGACTALVTQVEANLIDSNYTAEIEFIPKEEWENEIASSYKSEDNEIAETIKERIIALYGADAEEKTLEELKRDDKYTEIDYMLSGQKKIISNSDPSQFASSVCGYLENSSANPGGWYWPLVKSVAIKIPDCRDLLEHIVLIDIPGTGDCNKIRDDLWKTKLRECSSVWIVSDIKRAVTDRDPWGILEHCIEDLGPGGECKYINFICTKTDDIKPEEYLRATKHTKAQISGGDDSDVKRNCILDRNELAKKGIKQKLKTSKSKIFNMQESKERFITEVFTVSSLAFFKQTSLLKPLETEIPNLRDVLKSLNKSINEKLTRDYVNEAKGILSFIQSVQLDTHESMTKARVLKDLQRNLEKELKMLDGRLETLHDNLERCLSKGVEQSVTLCLKTTNDMILSVRPRDNRGFHKIYRALCQREGCYWPNSWNEPIDLNKYLTKHMYDAINKEFQIMFPVDGNDEKSMQKQVDKFNIIQDVFPRSTMLHPIETFIKTQETKLKESLSRDIIEMKKEIYLSIYITIQNKMAPGYKRAAEKKGDGSMKRMEKTIADTIEQLKPQMFNEAKVQMLQLFNDLKKHIMKSLESGIKNSLERSLSQTSKVALLDVSREIKELERLSQLL